MGRAHGEVKVPRGRKSRVEEKSLTCFELFENKNDFSLDRFLAVIAHVVSWTRGGYLERSAIHG